MGYIKNIWQQFRTIFPRMFTTKNVKMLADFLFYLKYWISSC